VKFFEGGTGRANQLERVGEITLKKICSALAVSARAVQPAGEIARRANHNCGRRDRYLSTLMMRRRAPRSCCSQWSPWRAVSGRCGACHLYGSALALVGGAHSRDPVASLGEPCRPGRGLNPSRRIALSRCLRDDEKARRSRRRRSMRRSREAETRRVKAFPRTSW
jgi:hypothetical protein